MSTITSEFVKWVAQQDSIPNPRDGFYPFDVIADAFDKGKEAKEKELLEKAAGDYLSVFSEFIQQLRKILNLVEEKGFGASELYINGSSSPKAIIAVNPEHHHTDEFIDQIYGYVSDIEEKCEELSNGYEISFVDLSDQLDRSMLREDGYAFQLDLSTNKVIKSD